MREQATRETHYEFGPLDRNERTALRDVKKTLIKALSPLSLARAKTRRRLPMRHAERRTTFRPFVRI